MIFRSWLTSAMILVTVAVVSETNGFAREIHVARTGGDAASGSKAEPLLTINRAAELAQPGDIVIVHGGTYREWVKPPRGGTSESKRIIYQAARGEKVFIKGSERITTWINQGNGVWEAKVPNTLFHDYNPYALNVSGGWLNYGQWHHRGDVYLNVEALSLSGKDSTGSDRHVVMTLTTMSSWRGHRRALSAIGTVSSILSSRRFVSNTVR